MPHVDKIIEWLKTLDEETLCDLLGIHTQHIIDRFMDVIQERKQMLDSEYEEPFMDIDDDDDDSEYGFRIIKELDDSDYEEEDDEDCDDGDY